MPASHARRGPRARLGAAGLAAAAALAGQSAAAVPARTLVPTRPPLVWVVDSGAMTPGDITAFDPATDRVAATIHTFANPAGLALSADGATLYTNPGGGIVAFDTGSQAVRATLPVSASVFALNHAGTELYAAGSNSVTVVDTHANTVAATIPTPGISSQTPLALNPNGKQLYVVEGGSGNSGGNGTIAVVDTAAHAVTSSISAVAHPSEIAFNAAGTRAYVADSQDKSVSVLDTGTGTVLATIPVGHTPDRIAATPSGAKLYLTSHGDQTLSVVDTAGGTVTSTMPVPNPEEVTVNGAGTEAYVIDHFNYRVVVVDVATDTVAANVQVGYNPQHIAVYDGADGKCPCSVFPQFSAPATADSGDPYAVVVGVKVKPAVAGRIDGVRFYKSSANTGTHTGAFWSSDGTLLATGTFTNETPAGWQTLTFANPVPVKAGATYVASYYAPNGHYAYDTGYFQNDPAGQAPITAPASAAAGGNGVYGYGGPGAFPNLSYNAVNYWVDVVFDDADVPTGAPAVTGTTPAAGNTGVSATTAVSATFSAPMDAGTMHFGVTDSAGTQVPGTLSYNDARTTATFTPRSQLPSGAVLTVSVQASDGWGNAMADPVTWSFTTSTAPPAYTCPCSLFGRGATPAVEDSTDPNSVELGVRFIPQVNGLVTGIRFYKGPSDTGVHTGTLWNDGLDTTIATGTFTNETAEGWQTLTFANPVAVTAGTTYMASYHAPVGKYAYTTGYFTYPVRTYPLTAPAGPGAGRQGSGSYGYSDGRTFPGVVTGTNYWVDVVFTASSQ